MPSISFKASLLIAAPLAGLLAAGCGVREIVCAAEDPRPACDPGNTRSILVETDGEKRTVDILNPQSHRICYRATARTKQGGAVDVTGAAVWTVDRPALGTWNGACFATNVPLTQAGIVRVRARVGAVHGEVSLILALRGSSEHAAVSGGSFLGPASADPGSRPEVVYPLHRSMHARNIGQMNLQFHSGAGNQIFRARFVSGHLDYAIYFRPTTCDGDRCQFSVPDTEWALIARTNSGTTAALTLSGAAGPGAAIAHAAPVALTFSPDDVEGGLYYFSTSLPGVMRLPFDRKGAARKATPFIIPRTPSNPIHSNPDPPGGCAGCHAVTFDGEKIAATYRGGDGLLGVASGKDAADFTMVPTEGGTQSNFQTFSPQSAPDARDWKLISNFGGELVLRDGNTGAEIARAPKAAIDPEGMGRDRAVMPEWSHDGRNVVFVRMPPQAKTIWQASTRLAAREGGDWLVTDAGEIAVLPYTGGQDPFGPARVVVPLDGVDFHYYPTWSPDDAWIIFNSGTRPGFSPPAQDAADPLSYGVPGDLLVSYDQATSRLRLVRVAGGPVVELARATVAPGKTSSWPKFTPFVQRGRQVMFFTFSSKMDYGFVVTGGRRPQLWMAAIDLVAIGESGGDPSYAPAWLPFQEEQQNNHLGVWAKQLACALPIDCPAQFTCDPIGKCVACDIDAGCC